MVKNLVHLVHLYNRNFFLLLLVAASFFHLPFRIFHSVSGMSFKVIITEQLNEVSKG